jgi:hypothetical protein
MIVRSIARSVSTLAIVGLLPAAFAASATVEQVKIQKEGLELIRQVEEAARDVRYDAGRLNSLKFNLRTSRWTHVHHLDQIKSSVNEGLRPALARLIEIQPQLPEWKQQSIDRMLDAAKMLAADIDSAILAKREADTVPLAMNAEYKSLVTRIYGHADALVKTSDAAGTYAAARLKAAEAGLELPTT